MGNKSYIQERIEWAWDSFHSGFQLHIRWCILFLKINNNFKKCVHFRKMIHRCFILCIDVSLLKDKRENKNNESFRRDKKLKLQELDVGLENHVKRQIF